MVGRFPQFARSPELVEGLVLLDHQVNVVVGGLFVASETLTLVENLSLLVTVLQLSPDFFSLLGNLLELVHLSVLGEASDFLLELDDLLVEFTLLLLHFVDHLVFFFLKLVTLGLDDLVGLIGRTMEFPLSVIVVILLEFESKLLKNLVSLHTQLDLALELLNLLGNTGDELTNC